MNSRETHLCEHLGVSAVLREDRQFTVQEGGLGAVPVIRVRVENENGIHAEQILQRDD